MKLEYIQELACLYEQLIAATDKFSEPKAGTSGPSSYNETSMIDALANKLKSAIEAIDIGDADRG